MSIENVIEKLNCATRCHPNAVPVLVSEAIEMLALLKDEIGSLHQVIDDTKLDKEYQEVLSAVIAERDEANRLAESLSIIGIALQKDKDELLAEREQWVKQKPIARAFKCSQTGTGVDICFLGDAPEGETDLYARPLPTQQNLAVFYGKMPESNGKENWTAILYRKSKDEFIGGISGGITIDRSEYPDRVRYEADRMRHLIGELEHAPCILDYNADLHSGYVGPVQKVAVPTEWREAVQEFVNRCEKGEIRSVRTYEKFKALLEASKS